MEFWNNAISQDYYFTIPLFHDSTVQKFQYFLILIERMLQQ